MAFLAESSLVKAPQGDDLYVIRPQYLQQARRLSAEGRSVTRPEARRVAGEKQDRDLARKEDRCWSC